MKVSNYPYGLSESYTVKYWFKTPEGIFEQAEETLYSNSTKAHKQVEKYFLTGSGKMYDDVSVISVIYN